MKETIIKAKDLCKSYATEGEQNHVLRNIDLDVGKHDFTVIMGSSGSGKSTLLYNLSGMDTPTSGEVHYEGKRLDTMSEKELALFRRLEVGFIFQQIHLVSHLTILENITLPGYLSGKRPNRQVMQRAHALMEQMGIRDLAPRLPSQASGGQQQRAAIARALINEPAILFADEPTGALNSRIGREILNLLTEVNRQGQSILMVTHDVKAAVRANRIIYLHDGKVSGEIRMEPYMTDTEHSREKQLLSWLEAKGW